MEDTGHVRDLVLQRMAELFCSTESTSATKPPTSAASFGSFIEGSSLAPAQRPIIHLQKVEATPQEETTTFSIEGYGVIAAGAVAVVSALALGYYIGTRKVRE